jgi:hypothetical protein
VVLIQKKYDINLIFKVIYFSVILVSCIGIAEFILKNIVSISNFDSYIYRAQITDYSPLALSKYIRTRSVIEESGHLALFLEIFAPFAIYYLYKCPNNIAQIFKISSLLCIFSCFISTFSAIGFFIALFVIIYLYLSSIHYSLIKNKINIKTLSWVTIVSISFCCLLFNQHFIDLYKTIVFGKFNTTSGEDRAIRISEALNYIEKSNLFYMFFGSGPGAYDKLNIRSVVGLYVNTLLELGLCGLLLFCVVFISSIVLIRAVPDIIMRRVLYISIFCSFAHYFAISNYWYPWLWFILALISFVHQNFKYKKK